MACLINGKEPSWTLIFLSPSSHGTPRCVKGNLQNQVQFVQLAKHVNPCNMFVVVVDILKNYKLQIKLKKSFFGQKYAKCLQGKLKKYSLEKYMPSVFFMCLQIQTTSKFLKLWLSSTTSQIKTLLGGVNFSRKCLNSTHVN